MTHVLCCNCDHCLNPFGPAPPVARDGVTALELVGDSVKELRARAWVIQQEARRLMQAARHLERKPADR